MAGAFETIRDMPLRKKAIMIASLAMGLAGIIMLFMWTRSLDYHVLYANLAEDDAGLIVQKLKELKVPYKVGAGGILVPSDKVYELRLQFATLGLPRGAGVGFELFDKTDFGATDFVQKLNYRRALQGELSRTIMALSEVEQCRVHLATPEKSLFVQDAVRPSASVLLKLRKGRSLSQGQVQGIVHLVSNSIEGLNPRDVTIIDSRGDLLTRPDDDSLGLSSSQLEYQRNYEKDIESRIIGILEPVAGKNKVRAKVTASIDFTKSEKTEEKYDPDGQVVRSEQKSSEKSSSEGPSGVAGVTSNVPGKAAAQYTPARSQSQKQSDTVNYEISRITSHIVGPTAEVKRLSAAVIVDWAEVAQEGEQKEKGKKSAPRSSEDMKLYEDLVKKAIGFVAERGDEVNVINMQFETMPHEELPEAPKRYVEAVTSAAKYIIPLVAVVLFFLFVLRPLMKILSMPQEGRPRHETAAAAQMAEAPKSTKDIVIEWAKQNPDQAINIIKKWIGER